MSGRGLGEARGLLLGLALSLGLGVVTASGPGNAAGAGDVGGGVGGVSGRSAGEAGPDAPCEALRAALEQALRQALAAETALLSRTRREICPDLEALAEAPALDFGALRACRQEAERQVQSRWPLLYTDQARFRYFTPAGAALAREADALRQRRAAAGCQLSSQPGRRTEESVHRTVCRQHPFIAGIEWASQQVGAAEHGAGR